MLLQCKTKELADIIKILSKTSSIEKGRNHNIIFIANKDKNILLVAVQNSTFLLRIDLSCQVEEEGSIVIPTKNIISYISNNDDEDLQLKKIDFQLQLKSKHYKININGTNDVPSFRSQILENIGVFDGKYLAQAFSNTIFCTQKEMISHLLSGVLLSNNGKLHIVGTDTYRLSEVILDGSNKECSIIVPQETVEILRMIMSKSMVSISCNKEQVEFKGDNFCLISSLIAGEFPNYKLIIPDSYQTKVSIETSKLLKAVKISQNENNKVKLEINNALYLFSKDQYGDKNSEIELISKEGKDSSIVINYQYFIEALSQVKEKNIEILLTDSLKPLIIRERDNFIHLIMPLKEY